MPIELVCFGFSIVGGLIGMLLFCLIWDDGFRRGHASSLTRQERVAGKVCGYHDGCPPDGPVCHLCAHLQPGASK